MKRTRIVPYGQKKVAHSSATWHPHPEPNKGAERQQIVREDVRTALSHMRPVDRRVLQYLRELIGENEHVIVTRREVAEYLGISLDSAKKILKRLYQDGYIHLTITPDHSPPIISIRDLPRNSFTVVKR